MSDKSQTQPVPQDDENKNVQPKNTVKLFDRYVPIWVVVLVIVVLAWVTWYMWKEHHSSVHRLTSSARAELDKAVVTSALPTTSSAGIPLSTPSTEETRRQLNRLFNSF